MVGMLIKNQIYRNIIKGWGIVYLIVVKLTLLWNFRKSVVTWKNLAVLFLKLSSRVRVVSKWDSALQSEK